jgi:hypothetical protein
MAAVQGERVRGGFVLITGIDGVRYAVHPQAVAIIHDADECRDETLCSCMAGMSSGWPARLRRCWPGSHRRRAWCRSMPRGSRTLDPGDFVKIDCAACSHPALLAPRFLRRLRLQPPDKVLDLKERVRYRGCGVRGRAVVSIKWER